MAFFQPITDTRFVNVIYAEDSEMMVEYYSVGLRWLLGIDAERLHLFEELDDTEKYISRQLPPDEPTVIILDNNTPRSGWTGYGLAMNLLREQRHNVYIVALSSSDVGMLLKDAGGEFWAKHSEGYLMMLWLAQCLRDGKKVSREMWLSELGFETRYRETTENRLPEDGEIFSVYPQEKSLRV